METLLWSTCVLSYCWKKMFPSNFKECNVALFYSICLDKNSKCCQKLIMSSFQSSVASDPNYGALWFRCKYRARSKTGQMGSPTTLEIMHAAKEIIQEELDTHKSFYTSAIVSSCLSQKKEHSLDEVDESLSRQDLVRLSKENQHQ